MVSFIKLCLSIILHPLVLIGLALAGYFLINYGLSSYGQFINNPFYYLCIWGIAVVYAFIFRHVYYPESTKVNWWKTFTSTFAHTLVIMLTIVVSCIIYYFADNNWGERIDRYARNQKTQDTLPYINQSN